MLTGMKSEEPLMIVSKMIASFQEGSLRRPGLIIIDLEATMAQSAARPRGPRDEVEEEINRYPSMRSNLRARYPKVVVDWLECTVPDEEVPRPNC